MARPNLDDPEEMRAYRKELTAVGRPLSLTGLAIIVVGMLLLGNNRYNWTGVRIDGFVVFGILVAGWGFMVWAFLKRNIHHRNRMAEPNA